MKGQNTPDQDSDELDFDLPPAPEGAVHCRVCTILIGPGYVETEPLPDPEGRGYVCWRCFESLQRQAERRARAERQGQAAPPSDPVRHFRRR
ncbi:MAG TPA: hypothetical protein VKZ60_06300 [Chloroflexota bacterium]|nr:hypothetical protein [Chloroflexota bacterium]